MASVGMAAGIAAAFNAPIAAVTFTLEELIGSLDQTMLSGVIVAAALAAVVEHGILGSNPIFHVPRLQTYTLVKGLVAGLVCAAWTAGGHRVGGRLPIRCFGCAPGSSGLTAGSQVGSACDWRRGYGCMAVVAIWFFHVNGIAGNPYTTLTQALLGNLPVTAMAVLCVLKLAATVTSYSSGGSGGIFAPALFMGGMLGGAVGYLDVTVFHHPADSIGAFAVVGMGAVFAGIVRAPMTSILIIFEMTGGYGLVLPLMIANMSAFALARHWRHTPVYEALLEQDGIYLDQRHKPHGPGGQSAVPVEKLRAEGPISQPTP